MKGEIRKYPVDSPKNWEGDDKDEKDASLNYGIFERELRKYGVDLAAGVFDGSTYHQDQRAMLDEIRRVLKENGLFLGMINEIDIPVEKFTLVSDREALEMYKKI